MTRNHATDILRQRALIRKLSELESAQHTLAGVIASVNAQVFRLRDAGVTNDCMVGGSVVLSRAWGIEGPSDTGELIQAAICSRRGLVAVFWDSEEFAELQASDALQRESEAQDRSVEIADCPAVIQWLVAKRAGELLEALTNRVTLIDQSP